jgi:hypothetical protein
MRPWTAGQKRFSFRFSQIAQANREVSDFIISWESDVEPESRTSHQLRVLPWKSGGRRSSDSLR